MKPNDPKPHETNPIPDGFHDEFTRKAERKVYWTADNLEIVRLRLLSDPFYGAWDVSYCYGRIDGEPVEVSLPFQLLPKRGFRRAIVEYAKRDGIHAKRLGILDNISTLC